MTILEFELVGWYNIIFYKKTFIAINNKGFGLVFVAGFSRYELSAVKSSPK